MLPIYDKRVGMLPYIPIYIHYTFGYNTCDDDDDNNIIYYNAAARLLLWTSIKYSKKSDYRLRAASTMDEPRETTKP